MPDAAVPPRSDSLTSACAITAATAVLIVGLTGCNPGSQPPPTTSTPSISSPATPTPTAPPTPSPTERSHRERQEAAVKQAVLDFYEMTNRVRMDPSEDYSLLKDVAAGELLEVQVRDLRQWRSKGWRATEPVRVNNLTVDTITTTDEAVEATVMYCADSTGVDVVDANGVSVVTRSRDRYPTITSLRKSESGRWRPYRERDGGDACNQ